MDMKSVYTFACSIGVTAFGMIFASGLSWLCTFSFSPILFISLIALLLVWTFSGAVKDCGWKKAFCNTLAPLTTGTIFMGIVLWFCGALTLSALHACASTHLTIIVGLVALSAFSLALLVIFLFFDFLCEISCGKIGIRKALHRLAVLTTFLCCVAIIGLTLYYVIYPLCLR